MTLQFFHFLLSYTAFSQYLLERNLYFTCKFLYLSRVAVSVGLDDELIKVERFSISFQYFQEKFEEYKRRHLSITQLKQLITGIYLNLLMSFTFESSVFLTERSLTERSPNDTTNNTLTRLTSESAEPSISRYCLEYINDQKCWGLKSLQTIPKGTKILFYAGELISTKEMKRRYQYEYDAKNMNYVLSIREHDPCSSFILRTNIDATNYGNLSRFINHSCDPNTEVIMERSHSQSILGIPAFRTLRIIYPLEEITFDYGGGIDDFNSNTIDSQRKICHCGTNRCRKFLPFDPS